MKLREWMYQAVTQVNVLSHEITEIAGADTVHICGRLQCCYAKASQQQTCRGLRQQHGTRWEIGELGRSIEFLKERYVQTSPEGQGCTNDSVEVGLTGSTRKTGKPATWGSGQQRCDSLNDTADALKSGTHHDDKI